jgi:LysR family nitrogen assimilation transcriptional regulator
MDIKELRYFRTIAEFGTLSKAAVQLRVTQAALSRHVANLEHELRVQLLRRSTRGVTLTDDGQALLRRTLKLEQDVQEMRREISGFAKEVTGSLNIAVQAPISILMLPDVVKSYRATYPGVSLHIRQESSFEMIDGLLNRRIDVAVFDVPPHPHTDLRAFPLWTEALSLVGPRRAAKTAAFRSGNISVAELASYPLLLPGRHASIRRIVDDAFERENLKCEPTMEVGGSQVTLELVRAGLGFTLMPSCIFYPLVSIGELAVVDVSPTIRRTISAVTRPSLASERTVAPLLQLIKAAAPKLVNSKRLGPAQLCD